MRVASDVIYVITFRNDEIRPRHNESQGPQETEGHDAHLSNPA
jgi:hypothetical protein